MTSATRLEAARAALLNDCEPITLRGITYTVPPVPLGAMELFCDLIQDWQTQGEAPANAVDTMRRAAPLIERLSKVFFLTVADLDEEITEEEISKVISLQNFMEVQYVLMRTSGLLPKAEASPATPEVVKPKARTGRTGTK